MVKLTSLIQDIESTPVSIKFLKDRVGDDIAVFDYKELGGYTRSSLFKKYKAVIVLIPHKKLRKGHFICILPKKNKVEYFSSLGMSPHQELVKLKQEENFMTNILGTNFEYNRKALQNQADYSVNTCGAFVYLRTMFMDLPLRGFQQLFAPVRLDNADEIAAALVTTDWI